MEIILPVVFGVLLIILIIVGILFYRRRRKPGKRSGIKHLSFHLTTSFHLDKFKLQSVSSNTTRPSIVEQQAVYGDDISTIDSEQSTSVWRPVQKRF